jgi:flagellar L-ring protein precursor FlgH
MRFWILLLLGACVASGAGLKKRRPDQPSAFDQYVSARVQAGAPPLAASAGSLYAGDGRLADGVRDLRAAQKRDLITVLVSDRASASSQGGSNTARKSSANASINSLAGPIKAGSALSNLAGLSGNQQLQAQGSTTRQSSLTTTLTAEVIAVLPNGNLVVEGQKEVVVNSERQLVTVRGVVRQEDLSPVNSVSSDRLAMLEVRVNGKGVVGDSIKRPFILYRLLLGLLPF